MVMKKVVVVIGIVVLLVSTGCLEKKEENPPTLEFSVDGEEGDGGWYISDVEVILNAYDNESKIKELKYRINGEMWKDYIMPLQIGKDGFYFIEFKATDANGNENHQNMTLKIDQTRPKINFTNFESGYIYFRSWKIITPRISRDTMIIGDFNIRVNASDTLSKLKKVEFYMGNTMVYEDSEKPYEWEIKQTVGIYNITAVAFDHAGNHASATIDEVQIINLWR